jgi:type 1 glutamine amidotransferase
MTVKELDRLINKTEITPMSKKALQHIRSAITSGKCGEFNVGHSSWWVNVDNEFGNAVRMSFTLRKGASNV